MAAHRFVLVVLFVVATLATLVTLRTYPDHSVDALLRWSVLYAVAAVVPCGWSLHHLKKGSNVKLAAAPAYVGILALLATLSLVGRSGGGDLLTLGLWAGLALTVVAAIMGTRRWMKIDG